MRLNLGCESYVLGDGFVNVDLIRHGAIQPDLIADAGDLPYPPESVDFIYAGHLLEHIYYDKTREYVAHWHSLLKPGGKLVVVVPDVGGSMRRYASGEFTLDHLLPQIFGQFYSWDREPQKHRYAYDWDRLVETVRAYDGEDCWASVERLDFRNPPDEIRSFIGIERGISDADWQIGVVCTK